MTTADTQFRSARAWSIAIMLALMMLVNFLDKVALGLVSVPMMRELHLSPTQFGLIGGSLNWLFAVAAVAGGIAANRWPAKWLLFGMAAAWSALQLPMLVAGSIWVVIACRVLLGAGEGPASPVAVHALYKWFPDARRNLPVALLHQGSALGMLIAGLSIPVVTTHWGWRANFAVLAALGALWCLAWAACGEEGTLVRGGRVAGTADIARDERVPYGLLLTDRSVIANFFGHFAANWILAMSLTWMPAYLQLGLGFEPHAAGRMFALFVATTSPLSLALAWLSQVLLARGVPSRYGRGVFVATTLAIAGLLLAALALPDLPRAAKLAALTLGSGMTLTMYSIGPAMLAEVTPDAQRGGVLALSNGFASLAGLGAPIVTGMLIEAAGASTARGFEQASLVCGVVLVLCGALGVLCLDPQRSLRRLAQMPHDTPGAMRESRG
ncbi:MULTISPECIES: MFS transporter [Burkholderia cepacia complex]|uniref:MFS transporter n=1 Tax=Burkholderia cepacia complex TaxID=87882 RepID=UPI00195B6059|nr:MFS transporter [Burkholderia cenocepacia]UJH76148.1 MFS transporter [Burkholderia cenocepacia]HEM7902231.1 MFS transporter [Burkholderia cenocepacia]